MPLLAPFAIRSSAGSRRSTQRRLLSPVRSALLAAVALGPVLAMVSVLALRRPIGRWRRVTLVWIAIAAGWVPAILVIGWGWDRFRSRASFTVMTVACGVGSVVLFPFWRL